MTLIENFLTKNDCYKTGKKITPKGLMLHSVGTPQPSAKVFLNNWNKPGIEKCVHGFIDANDGKVYQTLPWNHRGWHAGVGKTGISANNDHIGVEMCEPAQIKYTGGANFKVVGDKDAAIAAAKRAYNSAVELFAQLCVKYNLNPMTQIISHREGSLKGIASNHGDPEHIWNGLGLGYTMDTFRQAVKTEMDKIKPNDSDPTLSEPVKVDNTAPFKVRVDVDNLRIRKTPNGEITGKYTGKGIFTIVKTQNGSDGNLWGELKSGSGWIALLPNCTARL